MRKWRLALIVTTFITILLFSISMMIHFVANANKVDAATELTITVHKNEAVSVYVTGIGVTYDEDSSTSTDDIYIYESGTEYTLTAVNEKMIFYSWEITGATLGTINPNEMKYTSTSTEDLIVDTVRIDPTAVDYGKYMGNRFIISSSVHLIALQQIIAYAYDFNKDTVAFYGIYDEPIKIVDCYNYFCSEIKGKVNSTDEDEKVFGELTDADKTKFIKTNQLYERIRTGYFLIETSFSIFDMDFTGIGSYNIETAELQSKGFDTTYNNRYFDGVMCGKNGTENSQVVLVINDEKHQYKRYYGLFGYIGPNAVIRNLKVRSSIGISEPSASLNSNGIYAGAVAGYALDALLKDVDVSAEIGVNVLTTYEVCAGAIIGKADGFNIDDISNISDLGHICKITINTSSIDGNSSSGNGYVGYVAGYATNTYIKHIDVDNSDMTLDVRNHDGTNDNIGVGGLIGHYHNDKPSRFERIHYSGTSSFRIESTLQKGISSAGGLVGHLVSDAELILGDISIKNSADTSSYIAANTFDGSSTTNCYAGGLFGRIDGFTVKANEAFKNRIVKSVVDDVTITEYKPVFSGNIIIEAIQNGESNEDYGDTVSGGLVGSGYIDINGTDEKRTELILTTEGTLTITSTQTVLATHEDVYFSQHKFGDTTKNIYKAFADDGYHENPSTGSWERHTAGKVYLRHCMSGGVFGIIDDTYAGEIKNINVYADNIDLSTNREIGSLTMGNMYVGGFTGYSNFTNYSNISLKYNNGSIECNSLSYEVVADVIDTNNAYCGGFIGKFDNYDYDTNNAKDTDSKVSMNNCRLEGFDLDNPEKIVGTSLKITSIQNSQAPGHDYHTENYVGGLIGQSHRTNIIDSVYYGSESDSDYIRMAGHESPDSSFCGGIVGFIRQHDKVSPDKETMIKNCKVYNATVLGEGTSVIERSNPDMYIGGIVGATYKVDDNTDTKIHDCAVENSIIEGIGNERLEVYVGGLLGGVTWGGKALEIKNSYVYSSTISASSNNTIDSNASYDHTRAYAAGIIGYMQSTSVSITNNIVNDCDIYASCNKPKEYASGIAGYSNDVGTLNYNYSNAVLDADNVYGVNSHGVASSSNNFYHLGNCGSNYYSGTSINFDDKLVASSNHQLNLDNAFLNDDYLLFNLIYGNNNYTVDSSGIAIDYVATSENKNDIVEVWINHLGEATTTSVNHEISEEAREAGWFLMGYINIYNNTNGGSTNDNMTDVTVHFEKGNEEFEKQNDGTFLNVNYPNNTSENIGYDYDYESNVTLKRHHITAYVYDEIPTIKINFKTNNIKYVENFAYYNGSNYIDLDTSSRQVGNYGRYVISYDVINSEYLLKFYPNVNIDHDVSLRLTFSVGYSNTKDVQIFDIDLKQNILILEGATYAEYTPPVNYYQKNETGFGSTIPWLLPESTIIKIIPIFSKSNDMLIEDSNGNLVKKIYIDEKYIEKINYSTDNGNILSSGELTTPAGNKEGKVTITLKSDVSKKVTVNFITNTDYSVTHSTIGADIDMIPYASPTCDFEAIINVHAGYAGVAKDIVVTIGSKKYEVVSNGVPNATLTTDTKKYIKFQLLDENTNKWIDGLPNDQTTYFRLLISYELINGDIIIESEFEHIYEITFDLGCGIFYPGCSEMTKTFKVRHSTGFAHFFDSEGSNYAEIDEWVKRNTLYGYHFGGFYLVDNANSMQSYGEDFEDLLNYTSYKVTTSLRFYARWNFLIELVEAPGTQIKTSFDSSFMEDLDKDDAPISDGRVISVPINHTKGFVFTVVKDDNFLGEADVKAYVATKSGEQVVTNQITMEKYYEDMYLYFVSPDVITGYLIIVSSISNYGFIPGNNIATVTEEIIPEDGIYTFKYVANHKNTTDEKSYIYDSGNDVNPSSNLALNKEFIIRFYQQTYVVEDNVGEIKIVSRDLPLDTVVEVYYQKYVNGVLSSEIVGTTIIKEAGVTEVSVYDLMTLDFASKAFTKETFNQALGSAASVSEKYYVSITPPNGYSSAAIKNETFNYIIEGGYAERNNDGTFKDYVKGIRSSVDFANTPLENLENKEEMLMILKESSLQNAIYTVTPSRKTNLSLSGDIYTFTDVDTYDVFTIDTEKATSYGSRLCLIDSSNETNSIITSRELPFYITKMTLRMGYGVGDVKVTFSDDNIFNEDDYIKVVSVNSLQYSNYEIVVDNPSKYKYFQVDNVSLNEIRLEKLALVSTTNAMEYVMDNFTMAADKSITIRNSLENDIRHDGKKFVLAVQIKKGGEIVDSIPKNAVTLTANDTTVNQIITNDYGHVTVYYNLSDLLTDGKTSVNFTISLLDGYTISSVMLLEAENALKPAMAEVRYLISS